MSKSKTTMTLTVAEIIDLAQFAGLEVVAASVPDGEGLMTELTIGPCPRSGVFDDDDRQYAHIATLTEYPEEGCIGLGPELGIAEKLHE
jgi:hypothetical protein